MAKEGIMLLMSEVLLMGEGGNGYFYQVKEKGILFMQKQWMPITFTFSNREHLEWREQC